MTDYFTFSVTKLPRLVNVQSKRSYYWLTRDIRRESRHSRKLKLNINAERLRRKKGRGSSRQCLEETLTRNVMHTRIE